MHPTTLTARSRSRAPRTAARRDRACTRFGLCCSTVLLLSTPVVAAEPATTWPALPQVVPEPAQVESGHRDTTPASDRVQVWVDLTLPAFSAVPGASASSCGARRRALEAQQTAVAEQLRALGAVELARVQLVRNALAVELPASAVDEVRKLPGVLRVRPLTHRYRVDPPPPTR